jgi:glucose/arabinose dehydrogenase
MLAARSLAFGLVVSFSVVFPRLAAAEIPANQLTDAEKRGGWKLLFDGQTTNGWRNYKKPAMGDGWKVQDGALVWTKKGAGDIITADQYENYELVVDYKISKGGNSGLMFRVTEDEGAPYLTGPEVQIQDNVDGKDPQKSGWLYQLYKPARPQWQINFEKQMGLESAETPDATRPAGEWNTLYLRISPQQCEVCMNGVTYYYFKLGTPDWDERVSKSKFAKMAGFGKAAKGYICLQDHGNEVAFRNIKIRELTDKGAPNPIDEQLAVKGVLAFPNLQWDGWKAVDEEKGKVTPLRVIELTHARDGTGRTFVGTQCGMVHVFNGKEDAKQTKMFLDIRPQVSPWQKDNEEGFLGLAFHPRYKENGQFFVCYTSAKEPHTTIVSRFTVSKSDPDKADPASEEIVMKIPQPFSNHNGGSILFGHDGYLYIGLGDGGSRGDPWEKAQNLQKDFMGKVLRIDVDKKAEGKNYAIPADNPFAGRTGVLPETYAYGFRNIWRLGVDRATGAIWAADVGQDLWEEVNVLKKGGNYGWSLREGFHPYGNSKVKPQDEPLDPVWVYDHQVGKSITGGSVYRGKKLPELAGLYLYADFVTGKIWGLEYDERSGKVKRNVGLVNGGFPVLAFGEDEAGEAYYMIEAANGQGIYRFESTKK